METSDEYLKMVLALPDEFFKDLTPKLGDVVIALGPNIKMVFISRAGSGLGEIWNEVRYLDDERSILISDSLRIIPSQEQLQEKIMKSTNLGKKEWTPAELLIRFHRFISIAFEINPNYTIESWNIEWLRFCMGELYLLSWVGGKWQ